MAKRIVEAKQFNKAAKTKEGNDKTKVEADLYDFTFGIAHDAMTQFVVTFAALIHDIGKMGHAKDRPHSSGFHTLIHLHWLTRTFPSCILPNRSSGSPQCHVGGRKQ